MFNPKIADFLKQNPDVTVIGLYWAGSWRFGLVYAGIWIVLAGIASIFGI